MLQVIPIPEVIQEAEIQQMVVIRITLVPVQILRAIIHPVILTAIRQPVRQERIVMILTVLLQGVLNRIISSFEKCAAVSGAYKKL